MRFDSDIYCNSGNVWDVIWGRDSASISFLPISFITV